MEPEVWGASKPFTIEGDHLIPDLDLYDADIYGVPDPGLLNEEDESSFKEAAPRLFTSNSRWQNATPSARARQLWLLLRTGLQTLVEKEKRAELHVARLTHGLELLRRLEVAAGLCSVAQDPMGRRFVVLDGAGRLHLRREDGWAQEKLLAPVALTGLVAVPGELGTVGRFVGWGPAGLAILRSDLSLLWQSKPVERRVPGREPVCCLPVPDAGLLLVAEAGRSLVLWKFRAGGRCLVPRGSPLWLPPNLSGALARLALGPQHPPHVPRCCAAYGSAVLTFDLHTWAVTDVRRDLHKTTISDLVYCREVGAMVTASRDSTVKVWEADWQIRMVFVGHTGPVTAVAVLPNTALVLSASQDGTLRTWDLQAAAQVGEVAPSRRGPSVPSETVRHLLAPAGPGWPLLALRARSVELWRVRELYSPLAQLSAPVLHLQVAPALPSPMAPQAQLPTRLVCACADGSVYLVSVSSGRTVSALLLEPEDCAAAVAYCLPREVLWLMTRAGHLLCANAARCPMRVLHRLCPPPPPAPRPCCLHLYSHLTDPGSAFAAWEIVRQYKGELCRSDVAGAWKDKNRYLLVVGHTDGTLSVLELRSSKTVFRTEAHGPGPVTAIASTWNSIVSSGGDLTVKMWRVFPYAEESLSLVRTFSCCRPALVLCALGNRITVGFEDVNSATYGLVQFGLGNSPRFDHRPQDDPTDHITGLCCCPTLKLYACSSLDGTIRIWTAENRLLRLLQLNGAPQALSFCSNSGDLVLALGSCLCLVAHRLYLPTSYLIKKLCQDVPDVVDDPPLPLTSQESLTSAQLQRLASLRGVASLRSAGRPNRAVPEAPTWLPWVRAWPSAPNLTPQGSQAPWHPPQARPSAGLPTPGCLWFPARGLATTPGSLAQPLPYPTGMPPSVPPVSFPVCSAASSFIHCPTATPQQPVLEKDLEAFIARDQDLQQLKLGLVGPAARPSPSWQQCQEAFDNYLRLIYGPGLLVSVGPPQSLPSPGASDTARLPCPPCQGRYSGGESQQWSTVTLTVERQTWDVCALPRDVPDLGGVEASPPQDLGTLGQRFARPPQVPLPPPTTHRRLHSRAPQLLARSSPSHELGLSLQLQLQLERLHGEKPVAPDPLSSHLQRRIPLLLKRRPQEHLSNPRGFFPAAVQPYEYWRRPIRFPGCVPNSVVLQQMWLPVEVSGLGALGPRRCESKARGGARRGGVCRGRGRIPAAPVATPRSPLRSLEGAGTTRGCRGRRTLRPAAGSPEGRIPKPMGSREDTARAETCLHCPQFHYGHSLWEERCGHLPRFLLFFVGQNWFKKLFPIFTLQAYPEVGTVEGLASLFMDLLDEASWADRVHILHALLRLLPDVSRDLYSRLHGILVRLLNLDQPPSLQDRMQKQFVMLALQLLRACSLESREVVLELLCYVLYSPASCWPDLRKLLEGLGLQDPHGLLFKEMMTWVQGPERASKAALRKRCCQKLEEMVGQLKETLSQISMVSGATVHISVMPSSVSRTPSPVVSPGEPDLAALELQAQQTLAQMRFGRTQRALSGTLTHFCPLPEAHLRSSAPAAPPDEPLPLEQTTWSQSKLLDLGPINALNFFCEQRGARQQDPLQEEPKTPPPRPPPRTPSMVVPQPRERRHYSILRLQEAKVQRSPMKLRGRMLSRLWAGRTLDGAVRMLKLPLPRVELQPFPPDWPRPAHPLPPQLLQPALQRYFLPDDTDPDSYS
ncbi:LOW QUALITY PROTEIN: WD repeat-containing protein 97 [Orcinus orca]|uniref:LOW QUALITY PROTEIN: WD repeat-containing protein 97 n=1 Tax=Orcinus orca TaxID=9733 RepID=UPI002112BEE1|nr:LOW QUALITY PROTEIN: WD repeat-containing protein 97 [Orcinus orca]